MAYENNGGNNQQNNMYRNMNNVRDQYTSGGKGTKRENTSVTTTGIAFFNNDQAKFLNINYWGRTMSIEIGVCPKGIPMDWKQRQNAQILSQYISYNAVADLLMVCDEVVDSIKSTGDFTSVGVRVGVREDAIVEISNGSNINMPRGIYLVIYKDLDDRNCTNKMEYYPFCTSRVYRDYNSMTGSYKEDRIKLGEFKKFRKAISAAADALTMAGAHAVAESKKNEKHAVFTSLSAIGAALGVDMTADLFFARTTGMSSNAPRESGGSYTRNGNSNYRGNSGRKPYNGPRGQQRGNYSGPYQRGSYGNSQSTFQQQQKLLADMADAPVDLNLDVSALQGVSMSDFANPDNG